MHSFPKSSRLQIFQNTVTLICDAKYVTLKYAKLGSRGWSDGQRTLDFCIEQYTSVHSPGNERYLDYLNFFIPIVQYWQTGTGSDEQGGTRPGPNLSDLPPSALAAEVFTTAETERESQPVTVPPWDTGRGCWRQSSGCRRAGWTSGRPSRCPHGPVVKRGDVSVASTSLDYRYC